MAPQLLSIPFTRKFCCWAQLSFIQFLNVIHEYHLHHRHPTVSLPKSTCAPPLVFKSIASSLIIIMSNAHISPRVHQYCSYVQGLPLGIPESIQGCISRENWFSFSQRSLIICSSSPRGETLRNVPHHHPRVDWWNFAGLVQAAVLWRVNEYSLPVIDRRHYYSQQTSWSSASYNRSSPFPQVFPKPSR